MSWHVIPLDTTPDQEFFVSVEAGGRNVYLLLHLRYNTEGRFWKMDVSDGTTREMLISGAPLLTGGYPSADLMKQFRHLGIGSAVVVANTDAADHDIPGLFDLGSDFLLVWGDADA